jgi:hypothetical protein
MQVGTSAKLAMCFVKKGRKIKDAAAAVNTSRLVAKKSCGLLHGGVNLSSLKPGTEGS